MTSNLASDEIAEKALQLRKEASRVQEQLKHSKIGTVFF